MNCIDAQAAISDALDRIPVDAAVLEEAKEHCRACAECGGFVRALSIVKRAPLPEPPDDLTERVMASVRAEAARDAAARDAAAAAAAQAAVLAAETNPAGPDASQLTAAGVVGDAGDTAAGLEPLASQPARRPRMSRRATLSAWAAAAALFVITVTALTVNGVQSISRAPQTAENATSASKTLGSATAPSAQAPASDRGAGAGGLAPSSMAAAAGPSYVTVEGIVYRLVGPDSTSRSGLKSVGHTTSALSGSTPADREVLQGSDPSTIYIADDTGQLLAFERVTRSYGGRDYVLIAQPISGFGVWPSLPGSIPQPTNTDGSPTFTMLGKDDSGLTVYKLASGGDSSGIAVGPGTDPSDPANGDPNWTWWTPLP